jgi:uncharacterized protein YmfQ (DUF2313 family)
VYDDGLVELGASVASVSGQKVTAQVNMSGSTPVTYYIRVSSITGYEGKYSLTLKA